MHLVRKLSSFLLACGFVLLSVVESAAQCPQVYDFYGNLVDNPYWYSCSGTDFSFNLQSPDNWDEVVVDWGDGSPVTTQTPWTSPDILNHTYTATVDTFIVMITEPTSGCAIQGVVVMEEATSASIQIPVGGLTQTCAPEVLEFTNSSTNTSETTVFTWDFGDGSPQLVLDYTNMGETVSHLYEPLTVDCETQVSVTAENYCNTIQGGASTATFNPIRIWDVDQAAITTSATTLCYPDTTVSFTNTTERNCLFQGNIFQRYEYWNFGDHWGTGQDSIIDWTPWPPTLPYEIAYPGIGTYEVMMIDSNLCGLDTATITIEIIPPPIADIDVSADQVCMGDPITFFQAASGGGNNYSWNFDDGVGWLPTGGGNITYVYNTPGDYEVCSAVGITGSSAACADTACVNITVLPGPVANIGADMLEGCDNLTVDFFDDSQDGDTWAWAFEVNPFTFDGADPPPIDFDSPGTYVTNLTVTSVNGCVGTDQEVINVYQSPIPEILADNVCEGEEGSFIDLSTADPGDPILSWIWDFGDGSPTSSFQNPTHTYATTGDFTVTLTVNTANCTSTGTFLVSVEPAPNPSFTFDPLTGCSPLEVAFTNTSTGGDNYIWDLGDGNISTDTNPVNTFSHYGLTDTTFTVVLTAQTAFGCAAQDSADVTVQTGALAGFTDNSLPASCSPFEATFFNTSIGASSYLWDFGDGSPTSTDVHPIHLYENNTGFIQNYTVTLIAYALNGCNDTISSNVTVFPLADWDIELVPDSGCSPLIVTMPFVPGVNVFHWDFGDGEESDLPTPTHVYENTTLSALFYTVEFVGISAFGCVDTAYAEVQVNPQPVASIEADVTEGCSPLEVTFTNNSVQATSYAWVYQPGDTLYTNDLVHTHTLVNLDPEVNVFDVELYALSADGCFDVVSIPIEVYPEVQPLFDNPGPACSPLITDMSNNSVNATTYAWDLGDGVTSSLPEPDLVLVNDTNTDSTFVICLTALNMWDCEATLCQDVVVQPSPTAAFSMDSDQGCDPAPVVFTNLSENADSYQWDYGTGDTSDTTAAEHTYVFNGESVLPIEYTIELVVTSGVNGCADSTSLPYTLFPDVVAASITTPENCSPALVEFGNNSLGDDAGVEWDFGDGGTSTLENPLHTYIHNGSTDTTFVATLVATSLYGCTDTLEIPIQVFPTPVAGFVIDSVAGCYPLEVFFENTSIGTGDFAWVYGDGQVDNTDEPIHSHIYYNFGTAPVVYNVTLNMSTEYGCQSSVDGAVEVFPELESAFDDPDPGCSPHVVTFDNNSQGATGYQWDFGNDNTSTVTNPTHVFTNDTGEDMVFLVELVAQSAYGCFDTVYQEVLVYATPEADFTAQPFSQVFPDATVDITDNSVAGASASYTWNMGNGNFVQDEDLNSFTYETWGTFDIILNINTGACQDTAMRTIEIVAPLPEALFDGQFSGCAPFTVQFEDLSQFNATSFWNFGDGGSASVSNPIYTYYTPGTYDVSLYVTGFTPGQEDIFIIEDAVTVEAPAIAAFTYTPSEVDVPGEPVYTVNLSQNATDYLWNFGDGSTYDDLAPVHYYQDPGVYTITLVANNAANCPDTLIIPAAVNAISGGLLEFPNAFTPNVLGDSDGLYDPQAFDNDIFHPIHAGVESYELQIFNKWGELLFESENIWQGWTGYYRDELCKEDVYVWKATARFANGTETTQSGDVTLLIR